MLTLPLAVTLLLLATPAPAQANPLAGPTVTRSPAADDAAAPAVPLTIIERDFEGRLITLTERPEKAAAARLTLDPARRAAVDAFFAERYAKVSAFTVANYDLFLRFQNARQAGARDEMPALVRELRRAAGDLVIKPVTDDVAALLTEAQAADLRRLVGEYRTAAMSESPAGEKASGTAAIDREPASSPKPAIAPQATPSTMTVGTPASTPAAPARPALTSDTRAAARYDTNQFVREMSRGFAAMVSERRERTETLLKRVQATPEQDAQIRTLIRTIATNPSIEPTSEQRAEMSRQIMALLTPEQRKLMAQRE
ncbi:hypothetical protein BH11PLA1_BH11PLA1_16390 [soil metagenome]